MVAEQHGCEAVWVRRPWCYSSGVAAPAGEIQSLMETESDLHRGREEAGLFREQRLPLVSDWFITM